MMFYFIFRGGEMGRTSKRHECCEKPHLKDWYVFDDDISGDVVYFIVLMSIIGE